MNKQRKKRYNSASVLSRLACALTILKDVQYLTPIIAEIEAENQERDDLEEMFVPKRKQVAESAKESH